MNLLMLVLFLAAAILAAIELVRTHAEDVVAWGVLLIAVALIIGRLT